MTDSGAALHLHGTVLPAGDVRDVYVVQGRFTFIEPDDAVTLVDGSYLLPGLVDAHAHLSLHSPAGDTASPRERVRASARAQLGAGVLAIREPGSPDYESAELGPPEELPRTVTGGRFLAATGRYFPGLAREVDADQLAKAAAEEVEISGAWAKVIADFFGPDGRIEPTFPATALAEAAHLVHEAGGRITAHATCPAAIEAVVEAGFDAVEHGSMMRPDQVSGLAERGVTLVPTLLIKESILGLTRSMAGNPDAVAEVGRALDAQPAVVRQAVEHGIRVLAGTDAGMVPHGRVVEEIRRLRAAGLDDGTALGAASWTARAWLGLPGIEEGAPADVVAYPDDPRHDPAVLHHPSVVLLDGRLVHPRP